MNIRLYIGMLLAGLLLFDFPICGHTDPNPKDRDPLLQILIEKGILTEKEADAVAAEAARREAAPKAKAVPSVPPAVPLQITGEVRLRAEDRGNRDFNSAIGDRKASTLERVRLGIGANAGRNMKAFLQFQDSRSWGTEASTTSNEKNIDLHQGYMEIEHFTGSPMAIKAGRQELIYGDERLIGAFGWNNIGRAFDGVKLMWSTHRAKVDLWAAKAKESNDINLTGPGPGDDDQDFYGLYAAWNPVRGHQADTYLLFKRDGAMATRRWTLGGRGKGRLSPTLAYTAELAYQFGKDKDRDVSAYALAVMARIALPGRYDPALLLEYDYASGGDPAARKIKTFDQLFPTNHDKYGYMDYMGWQNMQDVRVGLGIKPTAQWNVTLDYHLFRLANANDAWYSAGGAKVFPATPGAGKKIGSELDLHAIYLYSPTLSFSGGISFFFPGQYVRNLNDSKADPSDWSYLQAQLKF